MGLLEQEIKEIRQLMSDYDAGAVTAEQLSVKVALYNQTEKRARLIMQAFVMAAKHGNSNFQKLQKINLIGKNTGIDLNVKDIEDVEVWCPIQEGNIARKTCLDYSGDSTHFEQCRKCPTGVETKKLLVREVYTA